VNEAESWRALVVDQARAENKCEEPEDDDDKNLDHCNQHEEDNIDRDRKLEGVY